MKLRELKLTDANRMLQWMHDDQVVDKLQKDFKSKTLEDCKYFIANSINKNNVHLAIANDNDDYMGTVSLKNIYNETAEFAIILCSDGMGTGMAIQAMREMLNIGKNKYGIKKILWYVAKDNIRALKFYDKNDFSRCDPNMMYVYIKDFIHSQIDDYIWYMIQY